MARQVSVTIDLTDDECAAFDGLSPADRRAFLVSKLIARFASDIAAALVNQDVQPLLSQEERDALTGMTTSISTSTRVVVNG